MLFKLHASFFEDATQAARPLWSVESLYRKSSIEEGSSLVAARSLTSGSAGQPSAVARELCISASAAGSSEVL